MIKSQVVILVMLFLSQASLSGCAIIKRFVRISHHGRNRLHVLAYKYPPGKKLRQLNVQNDLGQLLWSIRRSDSCELDRTEIRFQFSETPAGFEQLYPKGQRAFGLALSPNVALVCRYQGVRELHTLFLSYNPHTRRWQERDHNFEADYGRELYSSSRSAFPELRVQKK